VDTAHNAAARDAVQVAGEREIDVERRDHRAVITPPVALGTWQGRSSGVVGLVCR
jgi:hypothetical protein